MGGLDALVDILGRISVCRALARASRPGCREVRLGRRIFEGAAAVTIGFATLGLAVGGIGCLFRLNRYRSILRFALFVLWLGAVVAYVLVTRV